MDLACLKIHDIQQNAKRSSSSIASEEHIPYFAVDRYLSGSDKSFLQTVNEENPWFQLEFDAPALIHGSIIILRLDCKSCRSTFTDISITVGENIAPHNGAAVFGNSECTYYEGPPDLDGPDLLDLPCGSPKWGRYFIAQKTKGDLSTTLTLHEIIVLGKEQERPYAL